MVFPPDLFVMLTKKPVIGKALSSDPVSEPVKSLPTTEEWLVERLVGRCLTLGELHDLSKSEGRILTYRKLKESLRRIGAVQSFENNGASTPVQVFSLKR